MEFINMAYLEELKPAIKDRFSKPEPFRFISFDNILYPAAAELIHDNYPAVEDGKWDGTTYIHQNNKFQKTAFEPGSVLERFFKELNSNEFISWLEEVTEINGLLGDPKLFGGGLHQSIAGAFLDIHVDYNYHPETNYHRRLNVLIYLNKDWKEDYKGYIELWDMQKRVQLASIAPLFNRCIIIETNEMSFHGHPIPLNTPKGVSRKSIAAYYFTRERPANEAAKYRKTVYVNTGGLAGRVKNLKSGLKALVERIFK